MAETNGLLNRRTGKSGTEGSNPSVSANALFSYPSKSRKPSISEAFSVIRTHVYLCQPIGDRLERGKECGRFGGRGNLSSTAVKAAARLGRPGDCDGLFLVIHSRARQELDVPGAENGNRRGFGGISASKASLATARERAPEIRIWVELGLDLKFERRKAQDIPTFRQVAARVIAARSKSWRNEKHEKRHRRSRPMRSHCLIPTKIPSGTPDSQIRERKPTDTQMLKTRCFQRFFDLSGRRRKNKWCPEEDSNLHDLAIAST